MDQGIRLHAVVTGSVQGVGFRAFCQKEASKRGLHGWVKNCRDGSVELEAEGVQSVLEDFLRILRQGPPCSHVDTVAVDWTEPNRQTQGFTILR